jgi:hypothetical protein
MADAAVSVALNLRGHQARALRHDLASARSYPVRLADDATTASWPVLPARLGEDAPLVGAARLLDTPEVSILR